MTKLLIHIGTEKTGTTFLQQWLYRNAGSLYRNHGVLYPRHKHLISGTAHHPLSASLLARSERDFLAETLQRPAEEIYATLRHHLQRTKARKVVISAEHFSSRLLRPGIHRLAELLRPHDVGILAYIRWQDEMAVSHFSTDLRCGGRQWLTPSTIDLADRSLNPWHVAQDWISAFGEDAVQFRCYKQASANGIAKDLQAALGIKPDPRLKSVPSRNASLSLTEAQLLHQLNQHLPTWEEALSQEDPSLYDNAMRLRIRVLQRHRLDQQSKPVSLSTLLSQEQREHLLAKFADANDLLAKKFALAPPAVDTTKTRHQFEPALLPDAQVSAKLAQYLSKLGLDPNRIDVRITPKRGKIRLRKLARRISNQLGLATAALTTIATLPTLDLTAVPAFT